MKNEPTIGKLIEGDEKRDAIHVAISPARAAVKLQPGQDVGLVGDSFGPSDKNLGIVDPFFRGWILPGDIFWMFLYPGTITSLRHEWTHPELDNTTNNSEVWLRAFVASSDCPDYETLLAAISGKTIKSVNPIYGSPYEIDGEYLHFNGRDAHGEIPVEFWDHVENVTGQKCPERPSSFSCRC